MKKSLLLMLLLSLVMRLVNAQDLYPFTSEKASTQFQHVLQDLRCLVCQNQDIMDSHAPFAEDVKRVVYQLVKAGKSDDDIIHHLTIRYGDYIRFKPPLHLATTLLWWGPLGFILIGLWLFRRATRHE